MVYDASHEHSAKDKSVSGPYSYKAWMTIINENALEIKTKDINMTKLLST